jgi:hypothetical protein
MFHAITPSPGGSIAALSLRSAELGPCLSQIWYPTVACGYCLNQYPAEELRTIKTVWLMENGRLLGKENPVCIGCLVALSYLAEDEDLVAYLRDTSSGWADPLPWLFRINPHQALHRHPRPASPEAEEALREELAGADWKRVGKMKFEAAKENKLKAWAGGDWDTKDYP